MSEEECDEAWNARFAMIVAVILQSHAPKRYKFFQGTIGMEMWRQGIPVKVFSIFNYLGLSVCKSTARQMVDVVIQQHDQKILVLKNEIQV